MAATHVSRRTGTVAMGDSVAVYAQHIPSVVVVVYLTDGPANTLQSTPRQQRLLAVSIVLQTSSAKGLLRTP